MAVYVDELRCYGQRQWCHMAIDSDLSDLTELHTMAHRIGLRGTWFQDHNRVPHYDLVPSKRRLALYHGAVEVTAKELFEKCAMQAK